MMRLLLLLPMLAACSDATMVAVGPAASPAEQACAAQVDEDPAMREARAISAGRLDYEWQHQPEIVQIKRDAMTRCLKRRGLLSGGGVERPR